MAHLSCQCDSEWEGYQITALPVQDLWQSVPIANHVNGNEFYQPLRHDIENNGLKFPIIVVNATFRQLKEEKRKHKQQMLDLPEGHQDNDQIYVIWGGSNRYHIIKTLGYTTVDCVIIPNGQFGTAHKLQAVQRKPYEHTYYKRKQQR